jgi:ActR/RegA family two-component response regulator
LVIDDNSDWNKVFAYNLGKQGYEVDTCQTLSDAIFRLNDNIYDIVTVDMCMYKDEFAGCKVIQQIRSITDAHIIVLSGSTLNPEAVLECHRNGAIGYELKKYYLDMPKKLQDIVDGLYPPMLLTIQYKSTLLNEQDITLINEIKKGKRVNEIDNASSEATYKRLQRIRKKIGMPITTLLKYLKLDTFLSNDKSQKK